MRRELIFVFGLISMVAIGLAVAADNLTVGSATDSVLRTDEVGGAHYYVQKMAFGSDNSATMVDASNGLPVAQQGTWNVNNIAGTITLPTGAATAAKQPALGTAGTAATDVLTVQGIASMTPLAVTGTFWQATQPVSGTFWQATQPVSGPLTDTQLRATAVPVSIGSLPAGTNNIGDVDVLTLPALPAGGNNIGDVDVLTLPALVAGTANIGDVDVASIAAGNNNIGDVDVATLPALAAGTNRVGSVRLVDSADADLTVAKGAASTRLVAVQQSMDAGRQQVLLFWDYIAAANGTTALTNFTTGTRNATALSAANNLQVSASKTLRIQAVHVTVAATSATRFSLRCQIRQAATVANTSPVIWEGKFTIEAIGTLAADTPGNTYAFPIPDGLEVPAGQQITFTIAAAAVQGKAAMSIVGFEY